MKKYLTVVVALLTHSAMAEPESWYYCDTAHAYFPYVKHCPEPWREVDPNSMPHNASKQPDEDNPSAKPQNSSTIKAEPPKVPILSNGVGAVKKHPDEAFREGRVDRQHWEIWINGLTGDYRAGVDYWASHRSRATPGTCLSSDNPEASADWISGCSAAQQRLLSIDVRRKSEPDYRRGFNAKIAVREAPLVRTEVPKVRADKAIPPIAIKVVQPVPPKREPEHAPASTGESMWPILILIAIVVWFSLKGKGGKKGVNVAIRQSISTSSFQAPDRPVVKSTVSWVPSAHPVEVAGITIPDGMIYLGTCGTDSWNALKCMIDPKLPVATSAPDFGGQFMNYWPSYSTIRPESRLAYLQWLAGGRNVLDINIGYVFLYFYGLERRLLKDRSLEEADAIVAEVERLRKIYGGNGSFFRYSTAFLDAVDILHNPQFGETPPPLSDAPIYGLPPRLLIGLGAQINDEKTLGADWMLAWLLAHPETRLRTPARRAFDQFCELYRIHFKQVYPLGLKVSRPKTKIGQLPYQAASGDFTEKLDGTFAGLPNVSNLKKPVQQALEIAERCMVELEPFSRVLGKEPDAKDSLRAKLLLPSELLPNAGSDVAAVSEWLRSLNGPVSAGELIARLGVSLEDGKLGKVQARFLAEALERLGYGVEPDVRIGGRTPKSEEPVVLFLLPNGPREQSTPGPAYAGAALVLSLCALVIHADDVVTKEEERHLLNLANANQNLMPMEKARLEAHARWLLAVPPSLNQIQPKLADLTDTQRHDLAQFSIAVAAVDGQVALEEIKFLERLYKLLGFEQTKLFSDLHALNADGDEPVVVRPASPDSSGRIIPRQVKKEEDVSRGVVLDVERINRIRSDTVKVSSLLSNIFVEDTLNTESAHGVEDTKDISSSYDGLDRRHEALLRELLAQNSWSKSEFDQLCRQMELLPGGALESLNEWSFERFDEALAEDGDPILINISLVMPAMEQRL